MSKPNFNAQKVQKELLQMVDLYKAGHSQKAHAAGLKFLSKNGQNFDVLHLLGTIESDDGRLQEASGHWTMALEQKPNHLLLLNKMGALARRMGNEEDAEKIFRKAIGIDASQPEAHFNLGNCLSTRGEWLAAIQSYTNSIESKPDFVQAYNNLAIALQNFGRPDEAVKVIETGLSQMPNEPKLHVNKARALQAMALGKAAVAYLRETLSKLGRDFEVLTVLADMEAAQNDFASAGPHYQEALEIKPESDVVHNNYGNMLQSVGNLDAAMAHYKEAIHINPSFYQALQNLCNILNARKDYAQSLQYLEQVCALNPQSPYLAGMQMNARLHTCTWDNWLTHKSEVESGVSLGQKTVNPFPPLAFFTNVELLSKCAALWTKNECPERNVLPAIKKRSRLPGQKIRVGYYSADLYTHATALLMAGVLEVHDREKFEWIAFSFGPVQDDALSGRVRAAFDQFIDVRSYSDRVVAQLSREMEIDIAVDLKGFTQDARTGIFAERAAPIQVNYLGFPGSMGASYIDYIIADSVIITDELKQHYSEAVVRLPHCYQTNDNKRLISDVIPTRLSQGLPELGRVLCSFNNNYKITPQVFDVWMRVLNRFPDCVLWLLQDNPRAMENLKREAEARGVDPGRLVFAPRLRNEDHLSRHRLADLFIDTFPCNAHTTASDALWAGLPMVTCAGETFASRVAASLLNTMSMPDCVTYDLVSYEKKILDLLEKSDSLPDLRARVALARKTSPLFSTDEIARHLESAFEQMMCRYNADLEPEGFDVKS
jgi:predicted O-linked N-acetylglucosamine transferase (SPINDLY family)